MLAGDESLRVSAARGVANRRPGIRIFNLTLAHVPLEFVDGRGLRLAHDVDRDGLMSVAVEAFHLKIGVPGIECVAQGRRGLGRALKAQHALFQASQASLSAVLRASAARSADARTEAP
jgi:hypothetical protein